MANNNHFNLTLDTLAPSGSITRPAQYLNANNNLTIVKGDATFMKVWFNTTAVGTTSDAEYPVNPEAAAISKQTNFSVDGNYYYHMTLIDDVGNESQVYNTDMIIFDTTAPTVSNAYLADPDTHSHTITNDLNNLDFHFEYSDGSAQTGISGVVSATVTGVDIDTMTIPLSSSNSVYNGLLSFKSGTQDGLKTIEIVVTDAAGNISQSLSVQINLDTHLDAPVISLVDSSGNPLPPYIDTHTVLIRLTDVDTGVVGYKIWEDGETEPNYTAVSAGALDVTVTKVLSSNDGTKTIHAKVIDEAGSEASATDVSIVVDTTPPVNVAVTSSANVISNISGYNTATLTLAGSDAIGIASYDLSCGNTSILSGNVDSTHPLPSSFTLTSANSMVEGSNTLTWTITDKAGNSASDTCIVTLDTTAPTVSISALNTWYNADFGITTTLADNVAVGYVWAWVSDIAQDTSVPGTATALPASSGSFPISSSNIAGTKVQSASSNYMHVKLTDSVGNVAYAHEQFGYDSVIPEQPTIAFQQSAYISQTAAVTVSYYDATSGVAAMRITGDITNPTANDSWENLVSPRAVTLTSGDGTKSVYVQVKDNAGNVSVLSDAATCELDTTSPSADLDLYEADNTTAKPAVSPLATFVARITISDNPPVGDTDPNPKVYYKIWGDYTTGSQSAQGTDEPLNWTEFVPDSGKAYYSLAGYCTSGDGQKEIYLKVKDSAGNELPVIIEMFTYDTVPPVVTVTGPDYNIVSKENVLRRDSEGTIAGKYCDECNFTFLPSESIIAWKVCAYTDQTAALAGNPATDSPIPQTAGSINMSGSNHTAADITCKIKGEDFENALGTISIAHEFDGAHIVVVYVQDAAGVWSALADFSA